MKAWTVTEHYNEEEYACVVFAETRNQARAIGAGELDREYMQVSATRCRHFDKYANKGEVPLETLFEHGWYWTCQGDCCTRLDQDDIENNGAKIIDGKPYCAKCLTKIEEREQCG